MFLIFLNSEEEENKDTKIQIPLSSGLATNQQTDLPTYRPTDRPTDPPPDRPIS
jgi:hypothetical protein